MEFFTNDAYSEELENVPIINRQFTYQELVSSLSFVEQSLQSLEVDFSYN